MRTTASIANDVLQSFVYQKDDFAALKREFQILKADYYEKAIDAGLEIKKRQKAIDGHKNFNDQYDSSDYLICEERKKINHLENLHCKEIPALIKTFEGFFTSLDKILQMKISDDTEDDLFVEINNASKNLVTLEENLYPRYVAELTTFKDLFSRAFRLFTPLEAEAYPSGIDNLLRPRVELSVLANKTFDANRKMQAKGLYDRHSKIISLTLKSYLFNMRESQPELPYSTFSTPEFKNILRIFESFQKNLYPRLLQTRESNYKERLSLNIDTTQLREIFNHPSPFNQFLREQLSRFTRGDFEANKEIIQNLLSLDAFKIFNDLHLELGREPDFDEYTERIYEKSNPTATDIRLKLSVDIRLLLDSVAYRSTEKLRKHFHTIASKAVYAFGDDFYKIAEAQSENLADDLLKSGLDSWLNFQSQTPIRQFLADSTKKIFSKIDGVFYSKYEKDPISALGIAFDEFSMRDFKAYLKDIVDLSFKNSVDKKELLKFVYLISTLFDRHVSYNHQDSLLARTIRRLSGH